MKFSKMLCTTLSLLIIGSSLGLSASNVHASSLKYTEPQTVQLSNVDELSSLVNQKNFNSSLNNSANLKYSSLYNLGYQDTNSNFNEAPKLRLNYSQQNSHKTRAYLDGWLQGMIRRMQLQSLRNNENQLNFKEYYTLALSLLMQGSTFYHLNNKCTIQLLNTYYDDTKSTWSVLTD